MLKPHTLPEDWHLESNWTAHVQRHPSGNQQLLSQVKRHFDYEAGNTEEDFKKFLYLTQVHQAMSIKTETEVYRRGMVKVDGSPQTMGALYWQLNDIWPGPSWSSIEYGGMLSMLELRDIMKFVQSEEH